MCYMFNSACCDKQLQNLTCMCIFCIQISFETESQNFKKTKRIISYLNNVYIGINMKNQKNYVHGVEKFIIVQENVK